MMLRLLLPLVTIGILMLGVFVYLNYQNSFNNQKLAGAAQNISKEAGGGQDRLTNLEVVLSKLNDKVNKMSSDSSSSATKDMDRISSLERSVNDLKIRVSALEDNQASPSGF